MRLDDYVVLDQKPVQGDTIIASSKSDMFDHGGTYIVYEVTDNSVRVWTEAGYLDGFLLKYTNIRVVHRLTVPQLAEQLNTLSDL